MTNYGIFTSFWNGHPHHLPLMNMLELESDPIEWNLNISLNRVYNILDTNTEKDINEGVKLLLMDSNWRPHLIACVAILAMESVNRTIHVRLLWDRVLKGSWVCPQLLVTLYLIDDDFTLMAKLVLENGENHVYRLKNKEAIDYLLTGVVNDHNTGDSGGSLAKGWRKNICELIKTGRVRASGIVCD